MPKGCQKGSPGGVHEVSVSCVFHPFSLLGPLGGHAGPPEPPVDPPGSLFGVCFTISSHFLLLFWSLRGRFSLPLGCSNPLHKKNDSIPPLLSTCKNVSCQARWRGWPVGQLDKHQICKHEVCEDIVLLSKCKV